MILMDLRMSGMDGVTAIEEIQARRLATHILVLTTYDSDADIMRAVEAGATGYLLKDAPRQDLFRAVCAAAQGETVLAPAVASRLSGRVRAPVEETLTERENRGIGVGASGNSNAQIGKALFISKATVKTHLVNIFAKLDVSDRTSAVTVALTRGILRLP